MICTYTHKNTFRHIFFLEYYIETEFIRIENRKNAKMSFYPSLHEFTMIEMESFEEYREKSAYVTSMSLSKVCYSYFVALCF